VAVPVEAPAEGSAPATAAAPAAVQPTTQQAAIIGDLHWLIHQGHVIEFANGILETAKKPLPKPVRPPKEKTVKAEGETTVPTAEAAAEVTSDHVQSAHAETAPEPEAQPAASADTSDVPPAAS
jgi:hypothetical protein